MPGGGILKFQIDYFRQPVPSPYKSDFCIRKQFGYVWTVESGNIFIRLCNKVEVMQSGLFYVFRSVFVPVVTYRNKKKRRISTQSITRKEIEILKQICCVKCKHKIGMCAGYVCGSSWRVLETRTNSNTSAACTSGSLTAEYPATVGNLFLRIRRSLKINVQLNQEQ